jgi:Cu+-exporting ATPase
MDIRIGNRNLLHITTLIKTILNLYREGGNIMAKDPVCGMEVDEQTAQWKSKYNDKTYYFCAERCKNVFDKKPDSFIK